MSKNTEVPKIDYSNFKQCTELILPENLRGKGIEAAINERSDNLLMPGMMPIGVNSMAVATANNSSTPAISVLIGKKWFVGRVLKVRFLDNPPKKVKDKIEYYAHQWEKHVNVKFVFGSDPNAEIRITCTSDGSSWSYLGTDALVIPKNKPTMHYGWFVENTPEDEFSRTTLHEFGHALGALHEHQHPIAGIPWNRPAVYEYYKQTQGWSKADVDAQIFFKYDLNQTNSSQYDKSSIMHYAIEKKLLIDQSFAVGWNKKLSATDKAFMKIVYPF